jgi:hypothetical protein
VAKQAVALRLEPETLEWLDGYAKERGASRQRVLEAAVRDFRATCAGGVPELSGLAPLIEEAPAKRNEPPASSVRAMASRAVLYRCTVPGCGETGGLGANCQVHRSGFFRMPVTS